MEGVVFVCLPVLLVRDALDCFHHFDDIKGSFDLFEIVERFQLGYHVLRALAEDERVQFLAIRR
jgi:hypothetical protein